MCKSKYNKKHNTYHCVLQIITKQGISTGKMYSTICVKWAADHFGLSLT